MNPPLDAARGDVQSPPRIRSRLAEWLRALPPDPRAELEDYLFQLITLTWGVITLAVLVPTSEILTPSVARVVSTLVLIAFGIFSLVTWWHARKGRRHVTAFFVGHLVALDAMWFPAGGSTTATPLFNFSLILLPVFFATRKTRWVMLLAVVLNVVVLFSLELVHPEWLVVHTSAAERLVDTGLTLLIALAAVSSAVALVVRCYRADRRRLANANAELEHALAHVRTLEGLLSVCAWCRRIRDDAGRWMAIESYVESHTAAKITHGVCPDCEKRLGALFRH